MFVSPGFTFLDNVVGHLSSTGLGAFMASANVTAIQITELRIGFSSGQAPFVGDVGFPRRVRAAAAKALSGFQSAMTRSQAGIPAVGTKTLDSIAKDIR